LVRSGANIKEIQKLARHAKAETTLKHYAKVAARDLRGAIEAMPDPTVRRRSVAGAGKRARHRDGRATHKRSPFPPFSHRRGRLWPE
jgi:hypothetical protein